MNITCRVELRSANFLSLPLTEQHMPILMNARQEKFCQEYVNGEHAGKPTPAARAAGYRNNAFRVRRQPDVARRIGELQAQHAAHERTATTRALENLQITKERVLRELARVAFANMLKYLEPQGNGDVRVNLDKINEDQ